MSSPMMDKDGIPSRRVLRKGTKSCMECKRRKTRCFFLSAKENKCVGCQRRGTTCLGQDAFPDQEYTPSSGDHDAISRRLDRFEAMLATVMERTMSVHTRGTSHRTEPTRSPTPSTTRDSSNASSASDHETIEHDLSTQSDSGHRVKALYASLPSQRTADAILNTSRSFVYVQAICGPRTEAFSKALQPCNVISALPAMSDHPTLHARSLLRLACALQSFDPSLDCSALGLRQSVRQTLAHYFHLATSLVTSDDDIIESLEGLECLMLEGAFLINTGNLRRAMVHIRRCVTLAQIVGLDRGESAPASLTRLDLHSQVSGTIFWDRVVEVERLVALLLGLPTAIPVVGPVGDILNVSKKYPDSTRTEKLNRFIVEASAHISYSIRYGRDMDTGVTLALAFEQLERDIPSEWWMPPKLHETTELGSFMAGAFTSQSHIIFFNLQIVLHLPYMLNENADLNLSCSWNTCIRSSREVLNRFIILRSYIRTVYCCRFVDFCAFTAFMTLLFAHMNNHQKSPYEPGSFQHQLALRRLEDRALAERVLALMEELGLINDDPVTRQAAEVVRSLLIREAEAATGNSAYTASVKSGGNHCGRNISVPHFGMVNVVKQDLCKSKPDAFQTLPLPSAVAEVISCAASTEPPPSANDCPTSTQAGGDTLPYLGPHAERWAPSIPQASSQQLNSPAWGRGDEGWDNDTPSTYDNQGMPNFGATGTLEDVQEWAFQGVDDMFFVNFLNSTADDGTT